MLKKIPRNVAILSINFLELALYHARRKEEVNVAAIVAVASADEIYGKDKRIMVVQLMIDTRKGQYRQ